VRILVDESQQHIPGYAVRVIVPRARSNRMEHLRPLMPAIHQALALIGPGQIIRPGA